MYAFRQTNIPLGVHQWRS